MRINGKYMIWYKVQVWEMYKVAWAPNEGSDKPAYLYSFTSVFDWHLLVTKGTTFHHIC